MPSSKPIVGKNDLLSQFPNIAAEWDYAKNYPLRPEQFVYGSTKRAWWLCNKGHSYQALIGVRVKKNNGCPYCSNHQVLSGFNDLLSQFPNIANEWDYERNYPLRPEQFVYGSRTKVWWLCEKGHSYQALIAMRTQKKWNCPFCSGHQVLKGFNDLATTHPQLLKEWDFEKNQEVSPYSLSQGSNLKVWWKCDRGHSYPMIVACKTQRNYGCPYCSGQHVWKGHNDLATTHPDLLKEWDFSKNKNISPYEVSKGCNQKVWWLCDKGHSYQAGINTKTNRGDGCPYCAYKKVLAGFNDLATINPKIASEWNYAKNAPLTPQMVTHVSGKNVWWTCEKGHTYQTSINHRTTRNDNCPYCSGRKVLKGFNDLATTHPQIAKEWNFEKNKDITLYEVSKGTNKKVWWLCPKGHSYYSMISLRTNKGNGCPICSYSRLEDFIKEVFVNWNIDFKKEYRISSGVLKGKRYDFYLSTYKCIVEPDGEQHFRKVSLSWEKSTPLSERIINDNAKSQYAFEHHVPLLRIPYIYDPLKNKTDIERLLKDFIQTKRIPQEIIDFYAKYEFSNYAPLAKKWNAIIR